MCRDSPIKGSSAGFQGQPAAGSAVHTGGRLAGPAGLMRGASFLLVQGGALSLEFVSYLCKVKGGSEHPTRTCCFLSAFNQHDKRVCFAVTYSGSLHCCVM